MKNMENRSNKTFLWAALALATIVGYQALAMRQVVAARPAQVVWIDIERVFAGLNARARADRELGEISDNLKATADAKRAEINKTREELEVLPKGTANYKQAEESLLQMSLEYQGYQEYANRKLEQAKARILGEIYNQIRDGSKKLAIENNFDYVFVNDSLGELVAATEQEMNRQISARRMLYATEEFDATDMLIAMMNRP